MIPASTPDGARSHRRTTQPRAGNAVDSVAARMRTLRRVVVESPTTSSRDTDPQGQPSCLAISGPSRALRSSVDSMPPASGITDFTSTMRIASMSRRRPTTSTEPRSPRIANDTSTAVSHPSPASIATTRSTNPACAESRSRSETFAVPPHLDVEVSAKRRDHTLEHTDLDASDVTRFDPRHAADARCPPSPRRLADVGPIGSAAPGSRARPSHRPWPRCWRRARICSLSPIQAHSARYPAPTMTTLLDLLDSGVTPLRRPRRARRCGSTTARPPPGATASSRGARGSPRGACGRWTWSPAIAS